MKITISNGGGLRSIHLASLLDNRGYLHKLYTTHYSRKYPKLSKLFFRRHINNQVIDLGKVHTNLRFTILSKIFTDLKVDSRFGIDKWFMISEMIDKNVSKKIRGGADIIFAESNLALHTMKKAKELGMVSILDRTNSHIMYQKDLLESEYASLGIKYAFHSDAIVEKGLKEYQEADYISVLSTFVKNTFLERGIPEEKLLLIPSGVNLKDFRQVKKEDDVFRIIYCGLSCIKKGTHYLLEAFRESNFKNAELWLIGKTSDDIGLLMNRYSGSYRSVGFVPYSRLFEHFSQGSVFVLPSLEEGMAKVTMEAMACGLPVIATENTGAGDIVREGVDGFVIPIRDKEALKEKMQYMYENREACREMGQNAKERVKSGFTWEDYADRIINGFGRVLRERKAAKNYFKNTFEPGVKR